MTATDAHIGVHFCRAATEATSGFRFHLLFGERCSRILERAVVFFDVQRTLTFDGVIAAEFEIALVEFDIDSSVSAVLLSLSRPHCSMQRNRAFLTACNGVDCKLRSCHAVAACNDVLVASDKEFVNRNGVVSVEFDVCAVKQVAPLDSLTD